MPQFHGMVKESAAELRALGQKARDLDIRLSFHPSQFVVLNSPDHELVANSVWDLASQAEMLDLMDQGPEAVLVIHVGGTYGDIPVSRARWVETWKTLPEPVRRRLVLEHDDQRFSAADVLRIHEHTGVRLIFNYQHFWCLNPEQLALRQTLEHVLATWPAGQQLKIHYSSPRTDARTRARRHENPQEDDAEAFGYRAPGEPQLAYAAAAREAFSPRLLTLFAVLRSGRGLFRARSKVTESKV